MTNPTVPNGVVADLLMEWEDREERGTPVAPEELCRTCPENLPELCRRIGLLRRVAPLLDLGEVPAPARTFPAIPGFEVEAELGGGGMGVVYRALDKALGRTVAIKMPREFVLAGPQWRRRFEREARVLARLRHPNVVPVYAADLLPDRPYLVMDHMAGGTLARQKQRFRDDPAGAVAVVEQVARAVEYAHRNNVLHRDLKPSNIFLDERGRPVVGDFGVAMMLDPDAPPSGGPVEGVGPPAADTPSGEPRLTRTGAAMGTPAYMAPEQFAGAAGGKAADIWALGVILYELLTGRLPFSLEGPRGPATPSDPPRPRTLCPGLDRCLEAIALRCLAREPGRRYASAGALADALARWQQRRRGRTRRRWLLGLSLTAAVIALVALTLTRPKDEEAAHRDKLRDVVRTLRQGKPADLIAGRGPPVSFLVRVGKVDTKAEEGEDGYFRATAYRIALVELLHDPQTERYRFSAEVREDLQLGSGRLGIFYADQVFNPTVGETRYFSILTFGDLGEETRKYRSNNPQGIPGASVFHQHLYYREPGAPLGRTAYEQGVSLWYVPPPFKVSAPGPWRRLSVEVTPETLRGTFDGTELDLRQVQDLRTMSRSFLGRPELGRELEGQSLDFTPRGSLGLYLNNCVGSFRNCRIEPLPSP